MEFEINETIETMEIGNVVPEKEPAQKINVQLFKMEDLKRSLEYIKEKCLLPLMRKTDFETIEQLMICYRTILASFETLIIGQEVISNISGSQ